MTDTLREIEIDTNPRIQMTPDAIRHAKRTLSEAEVGEVRAKVLAALKAQLAAELRN